ncbi:MAG: N-acetylmuramoyl-L-alanine amidase, partial [Clostridia bacterium]|nr:N-acetylmuramoyl-L-alanine amidase [Clostridia bacterium]
MNLLVLSRATETARPCAYGDMEITHCNALLDQIEPHLKRCGAAYVRTPAGLSPAACADFSNLHYMMHMAKYPGAQVFHYACHTNHINSENPASSWQSHASGWGAYIYGAKKSESPGGRRMADILWSHQKELYPHFFMTLPTNIYVELRQTRAPAIIEQIIFHDNPIDALWLHKNMPEIAENKAQALCETAGEEWVPSGEKAKPWY